MGLYRNVQPQRKTHQMLMGGEQGPLQRRQFVSIIFSNMLRPSLAVCVLLILASESVHAQRPTDLVNRRFTGRVTHVADGDTMDVVISPARRVRVRLHGVDTPESGEPFSTRALTFTRVLMFGRDVTVTGKDVDSYGRLVARIAVDNVDASESIIAAGLGCTYRRYVTDSALEAALADARRAKRGFWATGASRPACVAREARADAPMPRVTASAGVVGNVNSKVYHLRWIHTRR